MRIGFGKMRSNAMDRCYRDFEGIGIKDKDFMMEL